MPGDFLDSKILVYAFSDDPRTVTARALLERGCTISVQGLNEFANVARRKMGLSWKETREILATLQELLSVHPVTVETHETGLALAERYGFSIYDSMIVASALLAGCDRLLSQDMQHGLRLKEGSRVFDPFREARRSP